MNDAQRIEFEDLKKDYPQAAVVETLDFHTDEVKCRELVMPASRPEHRGAVLIAVEEEVDR